MSIRRILNIIITSAPTWSNTSDVIGWLEHQQNLMYGHKSTSRFVESCGKFFPELYNEHMNTVKLTKFLVENINICNK